MDFLQYKTQKENISTNLNLNIFDNVVPRVVKQVIWGWCIKTPFKLGWEDTKEPEKYDLNLYSALETSDLEYAGILPYFEKCINETEWFTNNKLSKIILNLVRSDDVHYIHSHVGQQVLLYYVNLDWMDGWYGETLFYDSYDSNNVIFTSTYKPGRIILFDGNIPHAIRPQSVKAPKFRFTLSLFFD